MSNSKKSSKIVEPSEPYQIPTHEAGPAEVTPEPSGWVDPKDAEDVDEEQAAKDTEERLHPGNSNTGKDK